ncbi:MAG: site-specific integrase, partial [Ktedonobacteraceae bacterium]
MLQEIVNEYLTVLSVEDVAQDGAVFKGTNQNTVMAYRNDLSQACTYLARQQIQNWPEVTREHLATYLLEMREHQDYR